MHEQASPSLTETLSLEEEKEVRLYLLEELKSIIKKYASYYASDEDNASHEAEPTPHQFFAWIEALGEGEMYPSNEYFDEQVLAHDVRRFEKLYRELGNIALKKPVAQEIIRDLLRERPLKERQQFIADIVYVQPDFEELERRFTNFVHPCFDGRRLDPIERCKRVSKESRKVAFKYISMDCIALTDEVLDEMERKGLRPALYEELLGFALKYPDEQKKHPIAALGSEREVDGRRYVAFLYNDRDGEALGLGLIIDGWQDSFRFLAVRK